MRYRVLYSKSIAGRSVARLLSWLGTDIEITGCRVLYSKFIAGRGVAKLISWLCTAGPVDYINRVFDCYIKVY